MSILPRCLAALAVMLGLVLPAAAQVPTAFSYQGSLEEGGLPADGSYDLRFTLYDDGDGGSAVAGPVELSHVPVSGGLFEVRVDFGGETAVWEGPRWLQVEARPSGGEKTRGGALDLGRGIRRDPVVGGCLPQSGRRHDESQQYRHGQRGLPEVSHQQADVCTSTGHPGPPRRPRRRPRRRL